MKYTKIFGLSILFALVSGCGGSGGSSNAVAPGTGNAQLTWTPSVFLSSDQFAARCETPRTGVDPFSNQPYPDVQGTPLAEKLWQRSFTHETYLWFDEVPDNNPNNFTILEYFDQLKTTETTASGRPKDNFHFVQPTDEYNARTQGGTSAGYGFNWQAFSAAPPRDFRIRYVEGGSPADNAGIPRGAQLLTVDGRDFVNSADDVDFFNSAVFNAEINESHVFEFSLPEGGTITRTLTAGVINLTPVKNTQILDTASGRVGYVQFNSFIPAAQQPLIDAFRDFALNGITEVVLDLRYNGGGSLALSSQLGYMIAGPNQSSGRTFEALIYNSKTQNPDPIGFYDREINYDTNQFLDSRLPSPELTRVFVLSTQGTCSASESLINGLRGIDVEVVLIGNTTCGKPYGFVPEDNCGTTYFTIQLQGVNDKGFGDFADGFIPTSTPVFDDEVPGCTVTDDFSRALGDPEEELLATAINYIATGSCLTTQSTTQKMSASSRAFIDDEGAIHLPNAYLEAIINDDRTPITDPNKK